MPEKIHVRSVCDAASACVPEALDWPTGVHAQISIDPATYRLISTEVLLDAQASRDVCSGQTGLWRSLSLGRLFVTVDLRNLGIRESIDALQERFLRVDAQSGSSASFTLVLSIEQATNAVLGELTANQRTRIDLGATGEGGLALLAEHQVCSAFVASSLRSFCEPLGLEFATTPSPLHGLLLPSTAAPIVICLDVRRFVHAGAVDCERLIACVEECMLLADDRIDQLCWPLAAQSWDVFLNRRLALVPTFIGQCIVDQNLSPSSTTAIQLLEQLLQLISDASASVSARLARLYGSFPAMSPRQVLQGAVGRPAYAEWRERWQTLTADSHYRHRQAVFLALSELWPAAQRDDPQFVALVPAVLRAHGLALGQDWDALRLPFSVQQRLLRLVASLTCRDKLVPTAW